MASLADRHTKHYYCLPVSLLTRKGSKETVAELLNALDLGSDAERWASSSPAVGTELHRVRTTLYQLDGGFEPSIFESIEPARVSDLTWLSQSWLRGGGDLT